MIILEILGIILKIIGIFLLCILLLLLFIFLLLLFVPLRYRAQFSHENGKVKVHGQVSYLFRLIRLPVDFEEGKWNIKLKVFWLTLFSNEEKSGKKRKKQKKEKNGKKKGRDKKKTEPENAVKEEEELPDAENKPEEAAQEESDAGRGTRDAGEKEPDSKRKEEDGRQSQTNADRKEQEAAQEEMEPENRPQDAGEKEKAGGIFALAGRIVRGFADKVRAFFRKLAGIGQKIKAVLLGIIERISAGKVRIADLKEKVQLVLSFLRDEENKNGIKYAGKSIFRLLKHVFPYKIKGDIVFATGDAYSMGQAFSLLGIFYPLYGRHIKLTADFEAEVFRLEGRLAFQGRIRFGTILWIAYKLWRKGRIMRLLASAKELKHKLTTSAL